MAKLLTDGAVEEAAKALNGQLRTCKLNGLPPTRHTFASACLSDGLNPAKVAALLGDTLQVTHWRPTRISCLTTTTGPGRSWAGSSARFRRPIRRHVPQMCQARFAERHFTRQEH
jgi:hypothetical protein